MLSENLNLIKKNNLYGICVIFFDYLILSSLVILAILSLTNLYFYPIFLILIGCKQYSIGECLLHEATHENLFSNKKWNQYIAPIISWPFFILYSIHRDYHLKHHLYSLKDEKNNIYGQYEQYGLPKDESRINFSKGFWIFILKPILGIAGLSFFKHNLKDFFKFSILESFCFIIFWFICVFVISFLGLWKEFILYWFLPIFFVFSTLFFWSDITDHYKVSQGESRNHLGLIWNKLISHNIGYHSTHHQNPSIPWFNLPRAYKIGGAKVDTVHSFYELFKTVIIK